ncbi:MAG: VOC family protein [SAR324 cluster bacterium]|nr:VOC family protein [SAR324 cluster bacterium]MCZ6841780.1 VOC family protein [SAR324 cluster bacterium]
MSSKSLLWGAELDHIRLNTDDQEKLTRYYSSALGMASTVLPDDTRLLQGPERRIIVGAGRPGEHPFSAFRFPSEFQLSEYRSTLDRSGAVLLPSPSPVFEDGAFAIEDPDGRQIVFGMPRQDLASPKEIPHERAAKLPGRLQHVVVATCDLPAMMDFYQGVLGFIPSDHVVKEGPDGEEITVVFYRSTHEHHSLAVFLANEPHPDHHSYETSCWNDIRDWADHFSDLNIQLWWGPGRHGPGNNLFIMIEDPHGYKVELSCELEIMPENTTVRRWPHNERSLNLWGSGWMRS